jgi:hypothetical protein
VVNERARDSDGDHLDRHDTTEKQAQMPSNVLARTPKQSKQQLQEQQQVQIRSAAAREQTKKSNPAATSALKD